MRTAWSGIVAIAVFLASPGAARAKENMAPPAARTVVVQLDRSGISTMDLAVGKVQLHQLIVRDAPTDPEQLATLKPGSTVTPNPVLVVTDRSVYEVELKVVTTFLDEDGAEVLSCNQRGVTVDEDTFLQAPRACSRGTVGAVPVAQWARVKVVRLEITVQEQHN